MWEIRFAYDTEKQVLTVKNVTLKDGRATASNLGLSPYKLQVLDKNKKLFTKQICTLRREFFITFIFHLRQLVRLYPYLPSQKRA